MLETKLRRACDRLAWLWYNIEENSVCNFFEIYKKFLKLWSAVFHKFFIQHFDKITNSGQ
jgi:hypothetical protein